MVRKTKEDSERTRTCLLDAAQELFVKQGVSRTTLNDIAKVAGLTRGAVYWHFDNKDAIIIALWERGAGPLSDEMATALEGLNGINAAQHFRKTLLSVLASIVDEPSVGQAMRIIIHCVEITETQTPIREFLEVRRNHMFETFHSALTDLRAAGGLKSDLSITIITGGLMSYLYGLVAHHLEPEGFLNLENDYEALLDIYLGGIMELN